jgi:hypothetical protein
MVDDKVGERLASIETELKIMNQQWEVHTAQDKDHYNEISGKVSQLLIDRAVRIGQEKGLRRVAGWVSFCVATLISVVAVFMSHLMGGP